MPDEEQPRRRRRVAIIYEIYSTSEEEALEAARWMNECVRDDISDADADIWLSPETQYAVDPEPLAPTAEELAEELADAEREAQRAENVAEFLARIAALPPESDGIWGRLALRDSRGYFEEHVGLLRRVVDGFDLGTDDGEPRRALIVRFRGVERVVQGTVHSFSEAGRTCGHGVDSAETPCAECDANVRAMIGGMFKRVVL
jgi:hypothetical protein